MLGLERARMEVIDGKEVQTFTQFAASNDEADALEVSVV